MEKEKKTMDKEERKGIFFGIIGVLTLIIAIIGASFAYFSINARSRDNAVRVQAASVQIVYDDGQDLELNNLIPSTQEVALETQRRALAGEQYDSDNDGTKDAPYEICKDDKGYRVCGIYDFTLTNKSVNPVDVMATVQAKELTAAVTDPDTGDVITPAEKPFHNLKFILFDISGVQSDDAPENQNGVVVFDNNGQGGTMNYSTFGLLGLNGDEVYSLPGNGVTKKFRLFIWLNEAGEDNNDEQGATFKGTVHIDLAGAENITGDASSTLG